MTVLRTAFAATVAGLLLAGTGAASAQAQATGPATLSPHRAVYDLSLDPRRPARGLDQARGRILFETGGNRCEGFTTSFRQVVELTLNGDRVVMDVRTAHFEEGDGSGFRFTSQSSQNGAAKVETDGTATRGPEAVSVVVRRPRPLNKQIDRAAIFPTEHLIRLVEAAREGRTILEAKVYDGAETGEKLYNATAIIGRRIAPGVGEVEAAARDPKLAALARWPVTISYFEEGRDSATPVYSIAFELYENGVSRQLVIHYGEFSLRGELASLAWQPETACTRP